MSVTLMGRSPTLCWAEWEIQGPVKLCEDRDERRGLRNQDQSFETGSAAGDALGEAGHLDPTWPAAPHGILPRTELAFHFSGLSLDPDPLQGGDYEVRAFGIALVEAAAHVRDWEGQGEGDGTLVRRHRPAARVPDQHRKAELVGLLHRLPEARRRVSRWVAPT